MSITVENMRLLFQRHPLSDYLPYRGYEKEIFLNNDNGLGFVFGCQPITGAGEDTIRSLRGLFEANLPSNTTVQIAIHGSGKIQCILDQYVAMRTEGTIFKEMALKKKEMFLNPKGLCQSYKFMPRDMNVYVSVKIPCENNPDAIEKTMLKAQDIQSGVEQILRITGLAPQRLDAAMLIRVLYNILNPNHSIYDGPISYDPEIPLNQQMIWADNLTNLTADHLEIDGSYISALTVKQYPESFSLADMSELIGDTFQNLKQIPGDFLIVLNCLMPDSDSKMSAVNTKGALLTNQTLGFLAKLLPELITKKQYFDAFRAAINDGERPVSAFMSVFCFAPPDMDLLHGYEKSIQTIYRGQNFIMQKDRYITLGLLLQSLPLGLAANKETHLALKRLKTIRSVNAANLSPCVADWKGSGTLVVPLVSRRGQIMALDFFDNQQQGGNYNIAVAAAPGSGKSFFANEIICSYLGIGGRVWMLDAGKSYFKLCNMLKGEFVEFIRGEAKWCLNPFSKVMKLDDEEMAMLKSLFAQMASPSQKCSDLQLSWFEIAIKRVYENSGHKGNPTEVARVLMESTDQRQRDLGNMLFPYTDKGGYGHMFNGVNNMDFDNQFIVLELGGLENKLELRSVVLLQLIMNINESMYSKCPRDMRKLLMIDEAWDLLSYGSNLSVFFEKAARVVRKFGGSLVTITQGVNDYYDKMGPTGKAIMESSDFICLLRQKAESIQSIKNSGRICLSEYEFRLLNSVHTSKGEYSEIYVYSPLGRSIGRLVVDEFSYWLYTTNPNEVQMINDIVKTGASVTEAINEIISRKTPNSYAPHARRNNDA